MNINQRLLWFALLGTVSWAVLMGVEADGYKPGCNPAWSPSTWGCLVESPIVHLELALTRENFRDYIDCGSSPKECNNEEQKKSITVVPPNRLLNVEVARVNTYMDFLFIALYWSAFVLLARLAGGKLYWIVTGMISAAALFDIGENVLLLRLLDAMSEPASFSVTPGLVSRIKWCLFAISLLLLAMAAAKTRKSSRPIISMLLVLSAFLTIGGIFYIPILSVAFAALFAALLLALVHFFPFGSVSWNRLLTWIEFSYFVRFQIIATVLLVLVLPAGYFFAPAIFIGLFDALSWMSFIFVSWAAFQLAFTIMDTFQLVLVYGPSRFESISGLQKQRQLSWSDVVGFAFLASPFLVMISCGSTELTPIIKIAGICVSLGVAIFVLWLTSLIHHLTFDPNDTAAALYPFKFDTMGTSQTSTSYFRPVEQITNLLPARLQAGILDRSIVPAESKAPRLRSGHRLALIKLFVLVVVYVLGFLYSPGFKFSTHPPAAIFYLLFLLIFWTLLLSVLAFWLDAVRVPVITALVSVSLLIGSLPWVDHEFEIVKLTPNVNASTTPATPKEVVRAWEAERGNKNPRSPIIVVATAGGGIRAAAWTTQVLTGLNGEPRHQDGFTFGQSLLLVSSVSGGSVGNMYLVGSYDSNGLLPSNIGAEIRDASSRTSLSAVGWGLLYPDLIRTIPFLGWLVPQTHDRGLSLEQSWLKNWRTNGSGESPRLADWITDVKSGKRPAVIFNATTAESGQRFLIGSTFIPLDEHEGNTPSEIDQETLQFSTAFPGYDLDISTAGRASATFPWVSPMSRPTPKVKETPPLSRMHLADGGYYDNSGVMSATQWLLAARCAIKDHPVLIILIDSTPGLPKDGQTWSWQRQAVAPIEALLSVRTSSEQTRAAYELKLAMKYLKDEGMNVESAYMLYPENQLTPLSWHLTKEQVIQVKQAWCRSDSDFQSERQKIVDFLDPHHTREVGHASDQPPCNVRH